MLMLVHAQIEAADRLKIPGKRGESKVNLCIAPLAIAQKEKHGKNSTSSSKTKLQKQKQHNFCRVQQFCCCCSMLEALLLLSSNQTNSAFIFLLSPTSSSSSSQSSRGLHRTHLRLTIHTSVNGNWKLNLASAKITVHLRFSVSSRKRRGEIQAHLLPPPPSLPITNETDESEKRELKLEKDKWNWERKKRKEAPKI